MPSILRWIDRITRGLAVVAGVLVALIMLVTCLDVLSRTAVNRSIQGASELVVLFLVALVFLGLAGAQASGSNFSVTILVRLLSRKARRVISAMTTLIALVAVGFLTWFSWTRAIASVAAREESYGVIPFPVWPSRLIIAIGLTMLVVQLLVELFWPRERRDQDVPT
ncbi:MAG TPA: TRAP transporter small permease [Casimicrobiaceae bacterium]|nr:TRAP transporter small permease [Casimicrobiaceae bacterium]